MVARRGRASYQVNSISNSVSSSSTSSELVSGSASTCAADLKSAGDDLSRQSSSARASRTAFGSPARWPGVTAMGCGGSNPRDRRGRGLCSPGGTRVGIQRGTSDRGALPRATRSATDRCGTGTPRLHLRAAKPTFLSHRLMLLVRRPRRSRHRRRDPLSLSQQQRRLSQQQRCSDEWSAPSMVPSTTPTRYTRVISRWSLMTLRSPPGSPPSSVHAMSGKGLGLVQSDRAKRRVGLLLRGLPR